MGTTVGLKDLIDLREKLISAGRYPKHYVCTDAVFEQMEANIGGFVTKKESKEGFTLFQLNSIERA